MTTWAWFFLCSSVLSTGCQALIWPIFLTLNRSLNSLFCIYFLFALTGTEVHVGSLCLQTSLRNSRLRQAGIWMESMVREDGLNGNKTGNMCLKSNSNCCGSFRSCSCACGKRGKTEWILMTPSNSQLRWITQRKQPMPQEDFHDNYIKTSGNWGLWGVYCEDTLGLLESR